jgi:hypothetical protein
MIFVIVGLHYCTVVGKKFPNALGRTNFRVEFENCLFGISIKIRESLEFVGRIFDFSRFANFYGNGQNSTNGRQNNHPKFGQWYAKWGREIFLWSSF